ncbi:MAG: glycosyltransferase [Planctomycetota bacterium]|jgi:glycosyltransferase involved in cell wall biosynthesis
MRRLRICQLITELAPAGAERALYELSQRLDKQRFDVQVVGLRGGVVAEWLRNAGIRTSVLGVRGRWDIFKLRKLVQLLRRERIDILHTHLFHADLAGRIAGRMAGVPHLVHTIQTAEARWRPWQFAFARLTAGACEKLIAVSESVRDHHARLSGIPITRYIVIPNPVGAS